MFRRRGQGTGAGRGRGRGMGRRGGPDQAGPGGECECPKCGHRITHQAGMPCFEKKCPKCGTQMIRSNN
jgi:hypothetical protein